MLMMKSADRPEYSRSLEEKISIFGVRTIWFVISLHFIALVAGQAAKERQVVIDEVAALVELTGRNSVAALSAGDARSADEQLRTLSSIGQVEQAILVNANSSILGRFSRTGRPGDCPVLAPRGGGFRLDFCGASMFSEVNLHGRPVGMVGVEISIEKRYAELLMSIAINLTISLVLSFCSIPLWRRFAHRICAPLHALAASMDRVVYEQDLQVRTNAGGYAEVQSLAKCFNHMMTQLELRAECLGNELERRKEAEQQLSHLAYIDPVTRLNNRNYFRQSIENLVQQPNHSGRSSALLCIDLDGFKSVNDTLGHDAGDMVLKEVGARVCHLLRTADVTCRLGGDEFAVILHSLQRPQDAETVATKIIGVLSRPYIVDGAVAPSVSASVGIALFPEDATDPSMLMCAADRALYRAKSEGKGRWCRHEAGWPQGRGYRLTEDLRLALSRNELFLVYQPKVRLRSSERPSQGEPVGFEVLMRWRHPLLGLIDPGEFIELAEASGVIVPMGEWALQLACEKADQWRSTSWPTLRISVNLSPRQLADPAAVDRLIEVLEQSGLPRDTIELELTESAFVDRSEYTLARLHNLRKCGFRLSVDDFGTGYSSLAYIASFPLTTLKLDRTFIERIVDDPRSFAIAKAIVALADALELDVVAEGVETRQQVEKLSQMGGDMLLQGYLFSRPMKEEDVADWLGEMKYSAGDRITSPQAAA